MSYSLDSLAIHADDSLATTPDVSAPIHVTSTYRYSSNPEELTPYGDAGEEGVHIYSRISHPSASRVEAVVGDLVGAEAVVYASGCSAFTALLTHVNPKNVFVEDCYHGCVSMLEIWKRNHGLKIHHLDSDPSLLQPGDLIHLESPLNPTGVARDIEKYAKIAHERGAKLSVDATFAPPPLQDPFKWGADIVMHSGTKYFAGHSDLTAGILATKDPKVKEQLVHDRHYLGTILAPVEAWMMLRALRTFHLRTKAQYTTAQKLVKFLNDNKEKLPALATIYHADVQPQEPWLKEQLPLGGGPTFAIKVKSEDLAKRLPSKLKLFHHATSLGGVESLIEWRVMSDERADRTLLRISVGVEGAEDLIHDIAKGLGADDTLLASIKPSN